MALVQTDAHLEAKDEITASPKSMTDGFIVRIGAGAEPAVRLWMSTEKFEQLRAAVNAVPAPRLDLIGDRALRLVEGVPAQAVGRVS